MYVGFPDCSYEYAMHYFYKNGKYFFVTCGKKGTEKIVQYDRKMDFLIDFYHCADHYLKKNKYTSEYKYLFKGWDPYLGFLSRTKGINLQDFGICMGYKSKNPGTCSVWKNHDKWQMMEIDKTGIITEYNDWNEVEIFDHLYEVMHLSIKSEGKSEQTKQYSKNNTIAKQTNKKKNVKNNTKAKQTGKNVKNTTKK